MTASALNVYNVTYQTKGTPDAAGDPVTTGPEIQTLVLAANSSALAGIIAADIGLAPSAVSIADFEQIPSGDGLIHQ